MDVPGLSGWPSIAVTIIAVIISAYYTIKRTKSNFDDATEKAQKNAIEAMQLESQSLRRRIGDVEKENTKLEHTIETICLALKTRGILISIQGEMISVENTRDGKTTITRMHEKESI
jgi:hypothetical protein